MNSIQHYPYSDFFALETWCTQMGLGLVCHNSIRLIHELRSHSQHHIQPRAETASSDLERVFGRRFFSTEELLEEFSQDSSVLWFSAATYISGFILPERCYMSSVDRWVAVAGFSPFSGVYGGISLYKWVKPKLVHQKIGIKNGTIFDLK